MTLVNTVRILGDRATNAHRDFAGCLQFDGVNDWAGQQGTTGLAREFVENMAVGNRFALSFWVNAGTNSDYLFFNWQRTNRTFGVGNWNASDIQLIYGGSSSAFSLLGFQNTQAGAARTFATLQNQNVNGWRHCVINYDPTPPLANRINFTSNSRRATPTPVASQNPAELSPVATNYILSIGAYSYNTTTITYLPIQLADLMFVTNYNISAQEARQIFNFGRNQNYTAYPAGVMANRFAHYPLGQASDFVVSGPDLFARDISGNLRNMQVNGQGTTPNIQPFY